MSLAALLLAGGASRRMKGRDKLMEEVEGQPLIRRQAALLRAVSDDVTVALRPGSADRRAALEGLGVRIIEPPEALEGMGGTIRAGVSGLQDRTGILLLLADLPDLQVSDLRAVIEARQEQPQAHLWRGATEDGAPGHPILFAPVVYPDLMALSGDDGGRGAVAAHSAHTVLVPLPGGRARADLDTAEDWAAWRSSAGSKDTR